MIWRPLINAMLGAGYCFGFLLVWVGVQLLAFESDKLPAGVLGIGLGVTWWAALVWIGKRLRVHVIAPINRGRERMP